MKYLLTALICTIIGFSAAANNLEPKKENFIPAKISKVTPVDKQLVLNNTTNKPASLLRRYKTYHFTDACGTTWNIHVSASNATTNLTMWQAAVSYFEDGVEDGWFGDGCFHP